MPRQTFTAAEKKIRKNVRDRLAKVNIGDECSYTACYTTKATVGSDGEGRGVDRCYVEVPVRVIQIPKRRGNNIEFVVEVTKDIEIPYTTSWSHGMETQSRTFRVQKGAQRFFKLDIVKYYNTPYMPEMRDVCNAVLKVF